MKSFRRCTSFRLAGASLAAAFGPLAFALPFTNPSIPAFRGEPCSHFAGWESFTSAYQGLNLPDDPSTTATSSTIEQLMPGAILTTTGNLYHPFAQLAFEIADTTPGDAQEVVLQVSTQGNPRNYGSFILSFQDGSGSQQVRAPSTFTLLEQIPGEEELYFRWDLSQEADTIVSYTINFVAAAAHMSFDAVTLDARWECSPGAAYCFGDGLDPLVTAACPCANLGGPGRGCGNSNAALGGARLDATGSTSPNTVLFTATGIPNNNLCTFFRTPASDSSGVVFGDGVRCVTGTLVRFGQQVSGPAGGNPDFTVSAAPTAVAQGSTRYYQLQYRNPSPSFCPPEAFNVSNAYSIQW